MQYRVSTLLTLLALADLGGGLLGASPLQDTTLSFLHTLLPKSARVGDPHPPMGPRPPTGNPDLPLY